MASTDHSPDLADLHLLVLDDHQDTLDVFGTALRSCGANVLTARTARDAVTIFKTVRLDAIVSDLEMPGEDGFWVVDQLRRLALEKGGSIPALAVTAHWAKYTSYDAKAAGFDALLTKPVDPLELCRAVASLVGRAG
jgi:two-component system, chemotaxis family, CheB/CheR fusion protein